MASSHDNKASEQTYSSFISAAKWGTIAAVLSAALVIFLITR